MIAHGALFFRLLVSLPLLVADAQGQEKDVTRAKNAAESAGIAAQEVQLVAIRGEVRARCTDGYTRLNWVRLFQRLGATQAELAVLDEAMDEARPFFALASRFFMPLADLRHQRACASLCAADAAHKAREWNEAVRRYDEAARQFNLAREAYAEASEVFVECHSLVDGAVRQLQDMSHETLMRKSRIREFEALARKYLR